MERIDELLEEFDAVTSAIRFTNGFSDEGTKQLNQQHAETRARLEYDPDAAAIRAAGRPSPEQMQRAAHAFFAYINKTFAS